MKNLILSIDPGNVQSAYVLMGCDYRPISFDILPNEEMLQYIVHLESPDQVTIVIEMVASYGMGVGETVFETVFWIGRFFEAAAKYAKRERIKRGTVKMNLCHSMRAKDSNVRIALVDRFAPGDTKGGKGTKNEPGWFFGFRDDVWAAYAVGVTYFDLNHENS